jgi:hypothetical protein
MLLLLSLPALLLLPLLLLLSPSMVLLLLLAAAADAVAAAAAAAAAAVTIDGRDCLPHHGAGFDEAGVAWLLWVVDVGWRVCVFLVIGDFVFIGCD